MKKLLVILLTALFIMSLCVGGYFLYKNIDNNRVASTIYLDINPSIKITLNKNNKVINVEALNEDAKLVVNGNFEGKELDNVVKEIVNNVVEEGFVEEDKVVVLVNTKGSITKENVESVIKKDFEEKKIVCNTITKEVSKEAKENANKYGVSESKAAYIEELIENNPDLNFEGLKDKSVTELNRIEEDTKVQAEAEAKAKAEAEAKAKVEAEAKAKADLEAKTKQPESNDVQQDRDGNRNEPEMAVPSSSRDTSGVWCTFNTKRPQWQKFSYPEMLSMTVTENKMRSSITEPILALYGGNIADQRSSYCIARTYTAMTRNFKYYGTVDSVTGNMIELKKEAVPQFIGEDKAVEIGLNYFKITREDTRNSWAIFGLAQNSNMQYTYSYQVNMDMLDGTSHSMEVNAINGSIIRIYR